MALNIEWVWEATRFAALAAEWEAMLPATASPFDTHRWYAAWLGAFGAGADLAICTVRRDGRLAGVFPLRRDGEQLCELGNVHSPITRPVVADPAALPPLVEAVVAEARRGLHLTLPGDDPALEAVGRAARQAGMHPLTAPSSVAPVVDTSGEVEAWRKSSNKSWKARLARYRRKMSRDHSAVLDIVVAPDDLDAWLDDGLRLEASGWKGEAGTAILSDPATTAFYRDVAHRFHASDQLRLSRIVLDDTGVAFSYCILMGSTLYSLKTGYDESWRKLVPGLVLQLSIVERCFELEVETYELLGVTSDWKEKIATGTRSWTSLRVYPAGPGGAARYAYQTRLRPALRAVYRRVRPRSA